MRSPSLRLNKAASTAGTAARTLPLCGFVTYDAADRRSGRCSQKAAATYDVTRDAAYDGTSGGASVLL